MIPRVEKLLPDDYYLDKHFFPLIDTIADNIIADQQEEDTLSDCLDRNETIREVVFLTLLSIKPKLKRMKDGREVLA